MSLASSIEHLYQLLAKYKSSPKMDRCSCGCVSEANVKLLFSVSMPYLTENHLDRYAFKALSTWGDQDDFKHFFPRIFELMTANELGVDHFVIFNKIKEVSWTTEERAALDEAVFQFGCEFFHHPYFDSDALEEIVLYGNRFESILQHWKVSRDGNTVNKAINMWRDYDWLLEKLGPENHTLLTKWFFDHLSVFEEALPVYFDSNHALTEALMDMITNLKHLKSIQ